MRNTHVITKDSVIVSLPDGVRLIKRDQGKIFDQVVEAVETGRYEDIPGIISPKNFLASGNLQFDEKTGEITFNGYRLKNNLTDRIHEYWSLGIPVEPMIRLLKNIMGHEIEYMAEELFDFLEHNNLPITEDGCFLAYKLTKEDGSPFYHASSEIRYSVGKVIEMPKYKASTDRETCGGAGLYFGNPKYWGEGEFEGKAWIGSGKMFLAKINPRDVTAIPRHYKDGKAKCWRMEIVKEFTPESVKEVFSSPVYYSVRDSKGRFTKNSAFKRDSKGRFISNK